jgi:hypothetical protein
MLAVSYAAAHGLVVTTRVADFVRFPVDVVERRAAFLVSEADAVVVWVDRDPDVRRVLAVERERDAPSRRRDAGDETEGGTPRT